LYIEKYAGQKGLNLKKFRFSENDRGAIIRERNKFGSANCSCMRAHAHTHTHTT